MTPAPSGSSSPIDRPRDAAVLVGRDDARASLDAARDAMESGLSTVVLIEGEPGFGKTSLLSDMIARMSPARVLRATAEQDEEPVAYGVLGQLLRSWTSPLPPHLAAIAQGRRIDVDPLAVGVELLSLVDAADIGPLALVVDDIHWADRYSLRALVFALRRARPGPILVIFTCRSQELLTLPASLGRLLAERSVRIPLPAFGQAEVRDLARALGRTTISARFADRIAEHAGGSPLYVRAILDELGPSDVVASDGPLPVPASYARLVEARLRACRPEAAALARAAAITTVPRPLALLTALAGVASPLPALDAAVDAGLLQPPSADATVRLVHPLARAAVYQATPAARRAELHRRAAELLESIDEVAALRHRVAASDGADNALAERIAEQARVDAERGDHASAIRWLRAAVRLADPAGADADRHLLELIEIVVVSADRAAEPSLRAEVESRPKSALREYLLARLNTLAGRLPAARQRAQAAWELALARPGAPDAELRARVSAELARTSLTTGHAADAIEWARRALALAPAGSSAACDSPGTLLLATALQGDFAEALAVVAGLPSHIEAPTTADLDPMIARGLLSLWSGDLGQAARDLGSVVRLTRRDGPVHLNLGASAYLADVAYRTGEWDTAISEAETGIALALDLDHLQSLPMLHAAAAAPHADRGEFDAAAEHVDAALRAANLVGDVQTMLWARTAAGRLGRVREDADAVVVALEPLARTVHLAAVHEPGVQPWPGLYAWALGELGRPADAQRVLDDAARRAAERRQPAAQLAVQRARADLALRDGRLDDATRIILAAQEHYPAVTDQPFERAQFDLSRGIAARRAGERRDAAAHLQRARTVFERLRAAPWLAVTTDELGRCGVTRRSRRSPAIELTATEAVVTKLVASGLSNREIADHLVVSVKTAEYHVSNALAKVGVRSRTQLATWHLNRSIPTAS